MSILWLIPAAAIAAIPLKKWLEGQEGKGAEVALEEAGGVDSAEIWRILMPVYTKLRKAGAWLPAPWISSCIEAIEEGRECSPEAALAALIETGEDLAGTRWDTDDMADVFAEAAGQLAALI